jgi:hypothetical protein
MSKKKISSKVAVPLAQTVLLEERREKKHEPHPQ